MTYAAEDPPARRIWALRAAVSWAGVSADALAGSARRATRRRAEVRRRRSTRVETPPADRGCGGAIETRMPDLMDNVVPLPPKVGGQRRRRKRSKTALVLGGGGFTGAVYEIGALRALDLLSVNRTVNEFDVYVGTSAGSFVASLAANGVTPEEMMRVVNHQVPTPFRDIDVGTLLRLNPLAWARTGAMLPLRTAAVVRRLAGQLGSASVMDVLLGLAEALPSGLY